METGEQSRCDQPKVQDRDSSAGKPTSKSTFVSVLFLLSSPCFQSFAGEHKRLRGGGERQPSRRPPGNETSSFVERSRSELPQKRCSLRVKGLELQACYYCALYSSICVHWLVSNLTEDKIDPDCLIVTFRL